MRIDTAVHAYAHCNKSTPVFPGDELENFRVLYEQIR